MTPNTAEEPIHFAMHAGRARAMQRSYLVPTVVIILFSGLVIFGYDFAGEAESPFVVQAMFYGSILGVYAILFGLVLLERRKAPKDEKRAFLAVSSSGVDVDFGRGLHPIPFADVTGIVAVSPRADRKPLAIVFATDADPDWGRRDRNRVLHKVGSRHARLHEFKGAVVLPIFLFGDDQADDIIAAIQAQLGG